MKRSFFPTEGRWWKGNIHTHTTRTDGQCPPEQQITDYCAQGYDFLAITDHNVVDSHQLGRPASPLHDPRLGAGYQAPRGQHLLHPCGWPAAHCRRGDALHGTTPL